MGLKASDKKKEQAQETPEQENGIELTEDALDTITGGAGGFFPGYGNQAPWDTQTEPDDTMNEVMPVNVTGGNDECNDTFTMTLS